MEVLITNQLKDSSFIVLLFIIAASLFVLSKGADILVNEAVGLSIRFNISKIIIGATIVSLGTTLPETTVSAMAALKGNGDLAIGNAIGSIITNTALIIGISSLIGDMKIDKKSISFQLLVMISSVILFSLIAVLSQEQILSQYIGFILLFLLAIYLIFTSVKTNVEREGDSALDLNYKEKSVLLQIIFFILGVFLIIASSQLLIPTIEITALRIGIPQAVIAATLVAFGTSLPELVTAITAAKKGYPELAVGNVIGANILNILFAIGFSASLSKNGLLISDNFYKLDMPFMLLSISIFTYMSTSKNSKVSKKEGLILLLIYTAYLIINYI